YASNFMHTPDHLSDVGEWYRVGLEHQKHDKLQNPEYGRMIFEIRRAQRINRASEHLGVPPSQIDFVEHHLAHAGAAYYASPFAFKERVLVLTCDGAGDGLCATVSVGDNDALHRISATPRAASIGKIYSRVTYLMGMKAWEHEYKIMG